MLPAQPTQSRSQRHEDAPPSERTIEQRVDTLERNMAQVDPKGTVARDCRQRASRETVASVTHVSLLQRLDADVARRIREAAHSGQSVDESSVMVSVSVHDLRHVIALARHVPPVVYSKKEP